MHDAAFNRNLFADEPLRVARVFEALVMSEGDRYGKPEFSTPLARMMSKSMVGCLRIMAHSLSDRGPYLRGP